MANGTKKMSMFLAALFTAFTCMSYMPANAATKTTKTVVSAATVNYNAAVKAVVDYEKAIKGYKLTSKYNLDFCQAKYKVAMAALGKLNTKAATTKALVNRVMAAKKVWDAAYKNYLAAQNNNNNNNNPVVVATVESIAPVADVKVNEGEKVALPAEVTLNMSDKTTKTAKVTWGAVDTTKVGVVTVEGTVEGTDKKATVKVEVVAVAATVKEVVADTAKSFKVTFSKAVDTSKIKFEVKRGSVDVTVTPKWNDPKTEAVLDSSVKFVEGKYTVVVKNETSEMANKSFDITKERIAKIEIVGDMIVRTKDNEGYIAYKVTNQYGEDITSSALGRGIKFASVANIDTRQNGMLYVYYDVNPAGTPDSSRNPMLQLRGLKEVAITAYDVESNVSTTKTVKVSEILGSISEITFKGIKNDNNKELEYGDRVNRFYIDYEIKDAAGNVVTDYRIIEAGLQQAPMSSNPGVATARLIDDNGKAVFVVDPAMTPQSAHFDGSAVISVVTKSGKMASVNVTVKRPAMVDSVILSQPTKEIAAGEKAEIPFVAYDQNGKEVKDYNRIKSAITLDTRLELVQNADGTAKIVTTNGLAKGQHSFTVTTNTGKMSMVTVTVRDAVKVESLAVDNSVLVPFMVKGTSQSLDLGYLYGGIDLKDQYGRKINLLTNNKLTDDKGTGYYFVKAEVKSGSSINVTKDTAVFGRDIELTATSTEGTSIIEFKVYRSANSDLSSSVAVADLTRTVSLTVVKDEDVVDFTMDAISSDLYAVGTSKASEKEYGQWTSVYGKLANGGQVVIPDSWVKSITTSSDKFTTSATSDATGFYVYATTLPSTMTEASGKVAITAQTSTGRLVTTTIDVKSKSADRTISSIDLYAKANESNGDPTGIVKDGDTVYVKLTAANNVIGRMLTKYDANGTATNRGYVYFRVKDQYGKYGILPAYISVIDQTTGLGAKVEDGVLTTTGTVAAGNYIMVQAVTSNGLSKVVKIVFEN